MIANFEILIAATGKTNEQKCCPKQVPNKLMLIQFRPLVMFCEHRNFVDHTIYNNYVGLKITVL